MNEEWIQKLQVGDEVFVSQPYGKAPSEHKVVRLTPTQVIIVVENMIGKQHEIKFRRDNGRRVGGGSDWNQEYLLQPSDELRGRIAIEKLKSHAKRLRDSLPIPQTKEELKAFIVALTPFCERKKP